MNKFSESERELLVEAGDFCASSQLFNSIDAKRWPLYRGHALMMSRMLAKHGAELSIHFGDQISELLAKAPPATTIQVKFGRNEYGPTIAVVAPHLPGEKFEKYRNTVKSHGLWFDGESKHWFVPAKNMETTNFDSLFEKLVNLNFEVSEQRDHGDDLPRNEF